MSDATWNPIPEVEVDGQLLAFGLRPDGTSVPGKVGALLDELSATWGRTSMLEHHDAQTAKFRVIVDAAGGPYWTNTYWIGRPVLMRYRFPTGTGEIVRVFFRGRISELLVEPRDRHPGTRRHRGMVVSFTATGQLTDLGNRVTATEEWPDESGGARLDRLRALASPTVAGIDYREYWSGAPVAARRVDRTSVLALLQSMFDTAGADRMGYDPDTNTVQIVRRRAIGPGPVGRRARAMLYDEEPGFRSGVAPRVIGTPSYVHPPLDGRWIESDGHLSAAIEGRVTRIAFSYQSGGQAASGVIYDPNAEADRGMVAASVSTELRNYDWSLQCARDWLDMLWREGAKLQPPPLTYRADLAGGFPSTAHVRLLIGGAEVGSDSQGSGSASFLMGSPWSRLGVAPIVGVIGGTIRYSSAGWRPMVYTQAIYHDDLTDDAERVGPLRCRDLLAGPARAPFTVSQLARGLTFSDLRHVTSQ